MPDNNVTVSADGQRAPGERRLGERPRIFPDRAPRSGRIEPDHDLPSSASPPLSAEPHPPETIPGSIALSVHGDLTEVESEWREFQRTADCLVFQTFDWIAKLQRHIGAPKGTVPAVVLGRDGNGALLFILQLAIETHGPFRRLTTTGPGRATTTRRCWLSGSRRSNAQRIANRARSSTPGPMCASVLTDRLRKMPMAGQKSFVDRRRAHPSGACVGEPGRDWEAYYAAKDVATHKKERRQLKLAGHGATSFLCYQRKRADIGAPSTP